MTDAEAMCRGVLLNAAARQVALAKVEPERPSVDYLTGFGTGWEAGQVSALAFALSLLTGESPTDLVNESLAQAAVDAAFPFDLHIEAADEGAA
jgi:hypothetical protein